MDLTTMFQSSRLLVEFTIHMTPEDLRINEKWKVGHFGKTAGLQKTDGYKRAQSLMEGNIADYCSANNLSPLAQPLNLLVSWGTNRVQKRKDSTGKVHTIPKMDNDAIIKCVKDSLQGNKKDFPEGNAVQNDDWILAEFVHSFITGTDPRVIIKLYAREEQNEDQNNCLPT